jgi:hypothetical protein
VTINKNANPLDLQQFNRTLPQGKTSLLITSKTSLYATHKTSLFPFGKNFTKKDRKSGLFLG